LLSHKTRFPLLFLNHSTSVRRFTGHEHLADVGLIHMNGRVYGPLRPRA
jgi:hypothetical protein